MSFVHVGQIFYGYGWETLLLETGFLAVFLVPPWRAGPFPKRSPPSPVVILLLRWLVFRLMLGAGLIKLRGDPCWRDLTCLVYHYETQPNPNPLSWYFHQAPVGFHKVEVLFNHLVELVVPFFVFGPRRARLVAGGLVVLFQALLILSGNLSFLNWLTIAVAMACFDDGAFAQMLPPSLRARLDRHVAGAAETKGRRPCWISPYHYRIDWQMWFQDMPGAPVEPWFLHLVAKLLEGDPAVRALLAPGPFEDHPPRAIRARYYRYEFTRLGEPTRAWWRRTLVGEYLPPLVRADP